MPKLVYIGPDVLELFNTCPFFDLHCTLFSVYLIDCGSNVVMLKFVFV